MLTAPLLASLLLGIGPNPEAAADPAKDGGADLRADDYFYFSDFVDTRVTFALSNVNVFAGPGERTTQTSGYRIGVDPSFNLFLENVNTRFSGFESLSHVVLYKKSESFWSSWQTEAALAALVLARTDTGEFRFFDSGTYVRILKKLGEDEKKDGSIDLTVWPVSADRFRLGYTYIISWGGTAIFPGKLQSSSITEGAVPGLRLRWRAPNDKAYAFLGFKAALLLSREAGVMAGEQIPNYGLLGGAGIELLDALVLEANGGFFQKGTQERPGLEGSPLSAYGGSARLTYFYGSRPSGSADFQLYRNDASTPGSYDLVKPFKRGTGVSVALEGSILAQNLEDPDRFGSERVVPAISAGLVANAQFDDLVLRLDGFFQSADFILFNVPGFVPFQATPSASTTSPEFFAAASISYNLEDLHMRPRLSLGLKVPATYQGAVLNAQGNVGGARVGDLRTQVIVDETTRIVLPPDTGATPIIGVFLDAPLALSPTMQVAAQARLEVNDNQPRIAQDNERGEVTYIFDDPMRLSLALVFQARW